MDITQKHRIQQKLSGALLMIFGGYWTCHFLWLVYAYNFTAILFAFRLPDYVIIISTMIGLIISFLGILVFLKKQTLIRTLLITLFLVGAGMLLQ